MCKRDDRLTSRPAGQTGECGQQQQASKQIAHTTPAGTIATRVSHISQSVAIVDPLHVRLTLSPLRVSSCAILPLFLSLPLYLGSSFPPPLFSTVKESHTVDSSIPDHPRNKVFHSAPSASLPSSQIHPSHHFPVSSLISPLVHLPNPSVTPTSLQIPPSLPPCRTPPTSTLFDAPTGPSGADLTVPRLRGKSGIPAWGWASCRPPASTTLVSFSQSHRYRSRRRRHHLSSSSPSAPVAPLRHHLTPTPLTLHLPSRSPLPSILNGRSTTICQCQLTFPPAPICRAPSLSTSQAPPSPPRQQPDNPTTSLASSAATRHVSHAVVASW